MAFIVSMINVLVFLAIFHVIKGIPSKERNIATFKLYNNDVLLLNVGGELMYTTRDTLTYIPNTVLASIASPFDKSAPKLAKHDENGRIFLDLSPTLFKHLLDQLRRWKNRNNASADREILPPSWRLKNEFDEMLILLGLAKYKQKIPIECINYNISGDASRRVGSGGGLLCDDHIIGWTRFINRAGNAIVRQVPSVGCGGQKAGWLLGTYPTEPWTTTFGSLCYKDEMRVPCRSSTPIRTTHCGDFLVFELSSPPFCPARVCTDDYNL